MSDEKETNQPQDKARRFRIVRKVKTEIPETYAQQAVREAQQEDDADRGSPEMNREVNKGCMGCLRLVALFLLIMIASIVATWCITRKGV